MSLSTSISAVGVSYWTYMAAVLADGLTKVIRAKKITPGLIPKGVYCDALEFFSLVVQPAGTHTPTDPSACLNAFIIAAEAIGETAPKTVKEHDDVAHCLDSYATFIKKLDEPRELSREELRVARLLRDFFLRIQEDGENEAYERRFERGAPPVSLRPSVAHK